MSSGLGSLLNATIVKRYVSGWLEEDCPSMDYAGYVVGTQPETAVLLAKSDGHLAGCPFFNEVFAQLNCEVVWTTGVVDGSAVGPSSGVQQLAQVRGRASDILRGERVALNCLARASGVASISRKLKDLAAGSQWPGTIAGTRKTTPGFRLVEKYALTVAGVDTHRYDLSSMVMLKDNHIWTVGGVAKAVEKCRKVSGFSLKIEVECRSLAEAVEAAKAGCDVIMLDNFTPEAAKSAAKVLKSEFPRVIIETSGGINMDNASQYFIDDVDVISIGQLTQGYPVVNFSLKIVRENRDPYNLPIQIRDI